VKREVATLEDLPNVGSRVAGDLRRLGVRRPRDLRGMDPYAMFERLCSLTRRRHDPCLLDTFLSVVRFVEGAPARPWWRYTAERKRELAARATPSRRGP
jgi:hypothetical protein